LKLTVALALRDFRAGLIGSGANVASIDSGDREPADLAFRTPKTTLSQTNVGNYIGGNVVLGQLLQEHPDVYERAMQKKFEREAALETESFSTTRVRAPSIWPSATNLLRGSG